MPHSETSVSETQTFDSQYVGSFKERHADPETGSYVTRQGNAELQNLSIAEKSGLILLEVERLAGTEQAKGYLGTIERMAELQRQLPAEFASESDPYYTALQSLHNRVLAIENGADSLTQEKISRLLNGSAGAAAFRVLNAYEKASADYTNGGEVRKKVQIDSSEFNDIDALRNVYIQEQFERYGDPEQAFRWAHRLESITWLYRQTHTEPYKERGHPAETVLENLESGGFPPTTNEKVNYYIGAAALRTQEAYAYAKKYPAYDLDVAGIERSEEYTNVTTLVERLKEDALKICEDRMGVSFSGIRQLMNSGDKEIFFYTLTPVESPTISIIDENRQQVTIEADGMKYILPAFTLPRLLIRETGKSDTHNLSFERQVYGKSSSTEVMLMEGTRAVVGITLVDGRPSQVRMPKQFYFKSQDVKSVESQLKDKRAVSMVLDSVRVDLIQQFSTGELLDETATNAVLQALDTCLKELPGEEGMSLEKLMLAANATTQDVLDAMVTSMQEGTSFREAVLNERP